MENQRKRDRKGRFAKGNIGGPGRKRTLPKELMGKGRKGGSLEKLISDLLGTYEAIGSEEFLKKWATSSHKNLTKFVELLYRFAPHPEEGTVGDINIQVVSAVPRPGDKANPAAKVIKELRSELKQRDQEIKRLNEILDFTDVEAVNGEVIPPDALPEHEEEEIKEMTDDEINQEIKKLEEEVKSEEKESKG